MSQPRFVFLSIAVQVGPEGDPPRDATAWMLVSPNNRALGWGERLFDAEAECRAAVRRLQSHVDSLIPVSSAVETTGQWVWRVELAGAPVAVSSRSYLRARECQYNLERFLEAVPGAQLTPGRRTVRGGRRGRPGNATKWNESVNPTERALPEWTPSTSTA